MTVFKLVPLAALAAVALIPAPAFARDNDVGARGDHEMSRTLSNPRTQHAIGDLLGAMIGVMLDMPAEPLARMAEATGDHDAARRIPRGATLGDLAGPAARDIPREVRRRAPAMVGAMGSMAAVLEDAAPEFERIGRDFERQMEGRD